MVAFAAGLALAAVPAAAQTQPELLLQAEAQILSGVCAGQPVRLEGNHNVVTLTGPCGSLLLKGVANTVRLGIVPGGSIHVEGSGNRVQFAVAGALPGIVALGPDNDVAAGPALLAAPGPVAPSPTPASLAAPPSGPLALAGNDQHRIEDCAGRDVTVTGDRSDYVLLGACKSLTLRGDLLTVQADLAAAAKVTVMGRGSIVSWTMKGKAAGPAASIRGEGSRVQRILP